MKRLIAAVLIFLAVQTAFGQRSAFTISQHDSATRAVLREGSVQGGRIVYIDTAGVGLETGYTIKWDGEKFVSVSPETLFTAFSDDVFAIPALNPYGSGAIETATVGTIGGAAYVEGDELYVSTGTGTLDTLTVTAVDGGGAVTDFTITSGGTGHIVGDNQATTTNSLAGAGAVIDIDAVTDDGGDTQTITVPVAGLDVSKYAAVMFSDLATIPDEDEAGFLAVGFSQLLAGAPPLSDTYPEAISTIVAPHVLPAHFRWMLADYGVTTLRHVLITTSSYAKAVRLIAVGATEVSDLSDTPMLANAYTGEPLVGMNADESYSGFLRTTNLILVRIWLTAGAVNLRVQNADPTAEFATVEDLKLLIIQYQ